jgi:hypothetical protein
MLVSLGDMKRTQLMCRLVSVKLVHGCHRYELFGLQEKCVCDTSNKFVLAEWSQSLGRKELW